MMKMKMKMKVLHDDDEKVQDADEHDVEKTVQEDDDEEQTESDDDGDDFVHPKLTTHDDEIIHEEDSDEDDSSISSSDDEDMTMRKQIDKVMTDVEDTHVTLTPVNPDGQQQSSSVSSGFVSNMLNPNQDTGVDDIFRQNTEATSLIDTNITAIMEPSFTAQINRPPTPHPSHHSTTTTTILTRQLLQAPHYKYFLTCLVTIEVRDNSRRSTTANQQFHDSIDDGMKKSSRTGVQGSLQIFQKSEKFSHRQLRILKEFETVSKMNKQNKRSNIFLIVSKPTILPLLLIILEYTSVPAVHETVQPWLSNLAQQDPRESFDELTDSTFDFSAFVLNRLNVQTLTPELLAGPTFELMK
ncbi:hypothetical protein Tco_0656850 [Tanacetum coccineum]|uniref:Uncharacterized protein n=1 Tax=Tanacetum coccineum TaxID=301880 RepID=A0ABQ4XA01_9ASTR